jgi:hypothetical protein
MPVRFRLLDPGGIGDNQQMFELTGHVWPEEPYTNDSREITDCTTPKNCNSLSNWTGTTGGYGPTSHYDIVIGSAGGQARVPGDYLYRSWTANQYHSGLWGLFRVAPNAKGVQWPDTITIQSTGLENGNLVVRGTNTVVPRTGTFTDVVWVKAGDAAEARQSVNADGSWTFTAPAQRMPPSIRVRSAAGGEATWTSYSTVVLPRAAAPAGSRKAVSATRK